MRPVGARVLRFDSGFASEGCGIAFGHACGVRVQRVHKVQRVQRVQRGWYRRFAAMSFIAACRRQRCQRQRKPNNRACGALEMHPFGCYRTTSPGGGSFLAAQLLDS